MNEERGKTRGRFAGRRAGAVLALILAGGLLGWGAAMWLMPDELHQAAREAPAEREQVHAGGEAATIWTCSMHPQIQLPEPGKCPICFMDLIPLKQETSEGSARSLREIRLSESARRLAQVQTSPVIRRTPDVETRLSGEVVYDETRLGEITARVGGRIDQLYVDYTGAFVQKGRPMAEIYSPELYAAQSEFIQAVKSLSDLPENGLQLIRDSARRTADAAREKLRLLGMTRPQVDALAERGRPSEHVTLYAPLTGVVIRREVTEGVYVATGSPVYTVADISRVWVMLDAYESDLPWVRPGAEVQFRTEAVPGRSFSGKVVFIDPFLDERTRTARVRLEAENPDLRLRPGMIVRAVQRVEAAAASEGEAPLLIPASAPLLTGKRAVVYVALPGGEGLYEGREVVLGPRAGDWYVVREGLREGEEVVTRGAFRLDSALQIQAKPSMMAPEPGAAPAGGHDHAMEGPERGMPGAGSRWPVSAPAEAELRSLIEDAGALEGLLASGDLNAARVAFKGIHERIGAIADEGPEGEGGLLWREWTMLIRNDSLLGSEAVDLGEARFLHSELSRHMARLAERLGPAAGEAPPGHPDVPHAFRRQLGDLVMAYVPVSEALAADDAEGARKRVHALLEVFREVDGGVLPGPARGVWEDAARRIEKGIHGMHGAEAIDDLRSAFEPVSSGLIAAVAALGVVMDQPVFEVFCPMAFEDRGASWLQLDEQVRNPYFGAAMLACGEVKRRVDQP
ncbi:efflux RND transporter periplasmic adaptor subunit [Desulfatiglans anilini]|uniref:efflux RND transporter periplasmic adaptor subunit n=1 Tax=Desulfatiglans anilini TaxID=90728 RepID=UPI00041306DA|nr:efflux RND transporter periplasmic adaptor subunit [Desulfatiglans anilini]